ncbi:MAG TPA: PA14 domain-containing protein, partial [Niastella sp.]
MTGLKGIQMGLNASTKRIDNDGGGGVGVNRNALLFAWAPYTPYITMPMTNYNTSVTFKVGKELKGHTASAFISGYWGSEYIAPADTSVALPVFGYLNYQNYVGNRDALTDFNREKEITYREKPAVPHLGVPTYTYDVFSISGEGTGGTFRPYRGDIGYISDHRLRSKTQTKAFSADLGFTDILPVGVDLNLTYAYTQTGPWEAENAIGNTLNFRNSHNLFEASYFRNPGEKAINTKGFYDKVGGDDVVAPALSQSSKNSPTIIAANTLNRYNGRAKVGSIDVQRDSVIRTTRDKRAQVISYLTASEASVAGLDKYIYHHKINTFDPRHCDDISVSDTISLGTGLNGYFYPNTEFRGPYFIPEKFNETMHHDWERWNPYWCTKKNHKEIRIAEGAFPADNFTSRWLGRLKAPETGTYDFGVVVDDRIRVWLEDSLVIDTWKPRPNSNWAQTKLNLIKDHFYKLRIEYLELGGDGFAYVHLFWRTPSEDHSKEFTKGNNSGDKDTVNIKYFYPPVFTDTAIVDNVITREDRVNNFRKSSHISEIDVLNPDGRRYVYGIPVYNIEQKEISFSVDKGNAKNNISGMTTYSEQENSTRNNSGKQGFYSRQEIPAYAHSFLLTGILSPDYIDVTGNGISDDDQGDAVKFNYSKA